MNPMDFEEFLWVMGNSTLMNFIKNVIKIKNKWGKRYIERQWIILKNI